MNNILINRKYNINQGKVGWYSPRDFINDFASVQKVDFWDTMSSAGDWGGYFIQKIKNTSYLIPFSQLNNYPKNGYTLFTGEIIASWQGEIIPDDIDNMVQYFYEFGYEWEWIN